MKKLFRTRKNRALSTVISTILMIMVVMIGMTLLFAYVTVYAQNYKEGVGGAVMESLTIEDVMVQSDKRTLSVTVYNSANKANLGSDVDIRINAIYVGGVALINVIDGTINFNEPPVNAAAGQNHITFTCRLSSTEPDLQTGGMYDISIVTQRGSTFKAYFIP
jgi:FlaG/FlaF family flagellin (archaellin)